MIFMDYKSIAGCVDPTTRWYLRLEIARRRTKKRDALMRLAPSHCSVLASWEDVKATGLIHRLREINVQVQESWEILIGRRESQVRDQPSPFREHFGVENKFGLSSERKRSKNCTIRFRAIIDFN